VSATEPVSVDEAGTDGFGQASTLADHLAQIAGEKHFHPGNASSRPVITHLIFPDRLAPSNLLGCSNV